MATDAQRLVLKNHLCPGDVLCMSAAVHSLHERHPGRFVTAVDTTCPALWEHNPDVAPLGEVLGSEGAQTLEMHYPLVNQSNQRAVHVLQGYCDFLEEKLGVRVPLLCNTPKIYLSRAEKEWLPQVQEITGRPVRYWVVCAGRKSDYTAKWYPWYQEVIDLLQGKAIFVQVGRPEHFHPPLRGIINLIGKTDDRQLIRLVYHSSGVLCGTTFLMHLAAGLEKPAVVLAGGREPRQWNQYPLQTTLSTVGALDCCRSSACWRSRTVALNDGAEQDSSLCEQPTYTDPPAPKCLTILDPKEVASCCARHIIG